MMFRLARRLLLGDAVDGCFGLTMGLVDGVGLRKGTNTGSACAYRALYGAWGVYGIQRRCIELLYANLGLYERLMMARVINRSKIQP